MAILADLKRWRFWSHYTLSTFAFGGFLSGLIQFILIIAPSSAPHFQGVKALFTVVVIAAIVGLLLSWPRPIEQSYSAPKTRVRVIKGDLLSQPDHLVIGTCDTFDIETPNIISRNSLQGQALERLFNGDVQELNGLIDGALSSRAHVDVIDKPGKTKKYGVGTTAVIRHAPRLLFFLAYTEMNQNNEAFATVDGVWKSLLSLWQAVSMHANGSPVSIPVIGGGLARLSSVLPAQDSIRLIVLSFMFASRRHKVCDELRIVVQPEEYDRLDRMEIQAFLSSLTPS